MAAALGEHHQEEVRGGHEWQMDCFIIILFMCEMLF